MYRYIVYSYIGCRSKSFNYSVIILMFVKYFITEHESCSERKTFLYNMPSKNYGYRDVLLNLDTVFRWIAIWHISWMHNVIKFPQNWCQISHRQIVTLCYLCKSGILNYIYIWVIIGNYYNLIVLHVCHRNTYI